MRFFIDLHQAFSTITGA